LQSNIDNRWKEFGLKLWITKTIMFIILFNENWRRRKKSTLQLNVTHLRIMMCLQIKKLKHAHHFILMTLMTCNPHSSCDTFPDQNRKSKKSKETQWHYLLHYGLKEKWIKSITNCNSTIFSYQFEVHWKTHQDGSDYVGPVLQSERLIEYCAVSSCVHIFLMLVPVAHLQAEGINISQQCTGISETLFLEW